MTFWASFLSIDMDEKFWKRSQVLSLIASTNRVNLQNFHWNHHKLKNNNEIAKSWNQMAKKSLPDVIRKIGARGIVLWVVNYPNRWESLKGQNFFLFFCNTVSIATSVTILKLKLILSRYFMESVELTVVYNGVSASYLARSR